MTTQNYGCALVLLVAALFLAVVIVIGLILGFWHGFMVASGISRF